LDGKPINSFNGSAIDEAYTLRENSAKAGKGNRKHPNTFVTVAVKGRLGESPWIVNESPCLTSKEWTRRLHIKRGKKGGGVGFAILQKVPGSERQYFDNAPCLRSLPSTNGKQAGTGAYKVREFQGEQWRERPITATEAERLMGWEEGCTATGVTRDGQEIEISTTQRIKILGNGIIPVEVTEILNELKNAINIKTQRLGCGISHSGQRDNLFSDNTRGETPRPNLHSINPSTEQESEGVCAFRNQCADGSTTRVNQPNSQSRTRRSSRNIGANDTKFAERTASRQSYFGRLGQVEG